MTRRRVIQFLALVGLWALSTPVFAAQFTPGNLAIYRFGNGTEDLASGNAVSAFIDEYSPAGTLVQSIPLPTSGANALTTAGMGSRDGIIQLSQNGKSIVVGGYRTDAGSPDPISSNSPKAIGVIGVNGVPDTTTSFSNLLQFSPIRSVASYDGTSFYASGDLSTNSAVYVPYGASATAAVVQSGNWRTVHVENGQLYAVSGSTGFRGISTVGSGLPTTSQSFTVITNENNPNGGSPGVSSMDFANDTTSIIYAAGSSLTNPNPNGPQGDDFRRYVFNGSLYAGATGANAIFPGESTYGVYAVPDGSGGEIVYATTNKALYKIVDANPTTTSFSSLSLVKLADAPSGTEFRGLAGTPTPEPGSIILVGIIGLVEVLMVRVRRIE